MKIIDLLDLIARGEQPPKKILYNDHVYYFNCEMLDYYSEEYGGIFDEWNLLNILDKNIEILDITINWR